MNPCTVQGCERPARNGRTNGLCSTHDSRLRRTGSTDGPQLAPCGTLTAYKRHRAHGEEACGPCKEACRTAPRARRSRAMQDKEAPPAFGVADDFNPDHARSARDYFLNYLKTRKASA